MITSEIRNCFTLFPADIKSTLFSSLGDKLNIIVASHKNPDGDAIGSSLGLAGILKKAGHNVNVLIPDMTPAFLSWLPGYEDVCVYDFMPEKAMKMVKNADLLIIVDLSHPDRMGDMQNILSAFNGLSLQLDHHPGSGGFTTASIIDSGCGSTSELIFDFLEWADLDRYLDKDNATCLLTGIITDTLGFKVASSYPGVFKVVMKLMEAGADKDQVFDQVYNQYSENRLRLMGFCLASRMKVYLDQGAACIYLSNEDMNAFNHKKGDTEGFVNLPLSIKGIHFTILFTEQDNYVKLSLRSNGQLSVNDLAAKHFHGGGHHNAAGGKFYGSLEEALQYFDKLVNSEL